MDSDGQEFGQGLERMAYPCSVLSGASAGKSWMTGSDLPQMAEAELIQGLISF